MISQDNAKCINPWLGLLAITLICFVISAAIFIEFNIPGKHKKSHPRKSFRAQGAMKAVYPGSGGIPQEESRDTIIF